VKKKKRCSHYLMILCIIIILTLVVSCGKKTSPKNSVNRLITIDGLKTMVIGLDLYKKEFGDYPDSLEEFLRNKNIADRNVIEDGWGRKYHYTKAGDHYVLFSNGSDGKPFTDDDIYPQ